VIHVVRHGGVTGGWGGGRGRWEWSQRGGVRRGPGLVPGRTGAVRPLV